MPNLIFLIIIFFRQVPDQHSGTIAMIAALLISVGVTTGFQFTKIFEIIVKF
jgi:hypothetical protein